MESAARDIQNARHIIGQGPGWIERLEEALKNGAVLPVTRRGGFGDGGPSFGRAWATGPRATVTGPPPMRR
jgi:hypothetical protein